MTKEFFRAGNRAAEEAASPRELHEFRIVAKQFRYTLELFLPVCRRSAAVRLNQIKAIQTRLGAVNDCETVRVMLAKWGGRGRINRYLKKREEKNIEEFRRQWTDAFADPENQHEWLRDLQRFRITGRERPRPTSIVHTASRSASLA